MKPDAQKEFLRQWNDMHEGLDNSHRTAILTNGAKLNPFSMNAVDSQLIETRAFEREEVALWFFCPGHKLGSRDKAGYNSLEQENQSYLDDTLEPWFCHIEEECWDKLFREDEKARETHEFAFYRKALLRANLAARAAYYRTALGGHPWMEVNEVRADEDMNPDPEGYGIAKPLNMGKGGSDSGTPADEGDPEGKKGENGDTETKAAKSPADPGHCEAHGQAADHAGRAGGQAAGHVHRLARHVRRRAPRRHR